MTSSPARQPASHPAHILLARAHSPTTAAELFATKIKQKSLFLRTTSPPPASDKRALRRHIRLRKREYFLRKQKPRPLSAKQKRILGVHELKKEECKHAIYEGLHRMWVGYMQEVMRLDVSASASASSNRNRNNTVVVTATSHGSLLASADYHGAEVEVVRSGCVDRVGLKGIVVRDTKFTFVIVTIKDDVKTIPKKDTVFRFEIPVPINAVDDDARRVSTPADDGEGDSSSKPKSLVFELHGNQFEFRPADRAVRKFKWKPTDYL